MGFLFPGAAILVLTAAVVGRSEAINHLEQARMCSVLVQTCDHNFQDFLTGLAENPDVDRVCSSLENVRECVGDCISLFTNSKPTARATVKALEYVCEPSRRDEITTITQLQCFHDNNFHTRFQNDSETCVKNVARDVREIMSASSGIAAYAGLCAAVHQAVTCVSGKAAALCGDDVTDLIEKILHIVITEMTEGQLPNCFARVSVTHAAIRRSVGLLKQFRKK